MEPTSELEQALEEICSFEESFPVEEKESKQAKEEENKHKAQEIRAKAMESYGETKSRIAGDEAWQHHASFPLKNQLFNW